MRAASRDALTTNDIFRLIDQDLQKVEFHLKSKVESVVPLADDINRYLHDSGGKRLRPALLLLSSKLCEFDGEPAIQLGVVVELIHAATLVHDDIIDNARLRRGRPSVNAKWGNQITVLMGDWLYMTSFSLALQLRDFRVLDLLIDITRRMVEGELIQLEHIGRTDVSVEEQLDICLRKTAHLFSGCARLGGLLGNADSEQEEKLGVYGRTLGMAFQLADDLLDYTSNVGVLGKPVLKDLEEGRATLPITYLMERADRTDRNFIREMVRDQDFSVANKERILRLVQLYGTLGDTRRLAEEYAEEAKRCLSDFPDSIYREALLKVPELVISRER